VQLAVIPFNSGPAGTSSSSLLELPPGGVAPTEEDDGDAAAAALAAHHVASAVLGGTPFVLDLAGRRYSQQGLLLIGAFVSCCVL
jgi:hypothetical protein